MAIGYWRAISMVRSLDPLSARMTSPSSAPIAASAERTAASMCRSSLSALMMIETVTVPRAGRAGFTVVLAEFTLKALVLVVPALAQRVERLGQDLAPRSSEFAIELQPDFAAVLAQRFAR